MQNYQGIVNVDGVGWGASGLTELKGATRVRITPAFTDPRRIRGGGDLMPRHVRGLGVSSLRVDIETESFSEYLAALGKVGSSAEKLTINYTDSSGARKIVTDAATANARCVSCGQSDFPPLETGGSATRMMITFELEQVGTTTTKASNAFTESSGHGTLT